MNKSTLKLVKHVLYSFSEYTPPEVKSSERNKLVAKAIIAVDELINNLKKK